MKILHVINKLSFDGGPSITVPRICDELRAVGHDVDVWTPGDWLLQDKIAEADVVHLTGVYNRTTFPTLFYCRTYRKPLVWSPRGGWQRWSGSRRLRMKRYWDTLCRWLAPSHTVIHATSELEAQSVIPIMPRPIRVIANGVDVPDALPEKERSPFLRCLYLGRLDPKKGIERLIDSMAMLSPSCGIRLRIVGDGPRDYAYSLYDRAHGLPHVTFFDHVTHARLAEVFAWTDVTVVPSHIESFGQVIAESLAHGVPVLASRQLPWTLQDHGCGLSWEMESPLTMALMAFASIKEMRPQDFALMGENGRDWMRKEFSWSDRAREMVNAYAFASSLR